MGEFAGLGIYLVVALFFPVMALVPAFLLQPKQPSPEKYVPYECGVDPVGSPYGRFRAGYFLYALLFILFDIETVFLYPWAVAFHMVGAFAFVEMLVFVLILVLGLAYAWRKGDLSWK